MAQRVLFVHAHPDDETIATGAAIATLIERGDHVTVLTCTRGELGSVIPDELTHLSGAGLGAHRERELEAAISALGVSDHRWLGSAQARWAGREPRRYLDSGMRQGKRGPELPDPVDLRSLAAADVGEVAADIAAVMIDVEPDVVVSYADDGGYGHPDHIRTHEATRTAAEVLHVPFYVIDSPRTRRGPVRVDPAPVLERKTAALLAHRSQVILSEDGTFTLSSGGHVPVAAPESFTRVRPVGTGFGDHSLPARIAALVFAVVLGAFTGATLTAAHQATVLLGALVFPWGIVAALAITAALLVGLRLVFDTRLVAVCAAVGLLGAAALLAVQSTGGSVLVPENTVGYIWTFGPVLIALVVLAWPRLDARPRVSRETETLAESDKIEVPAPKGPELP